MAMNRTAAPTHAMMILRMTNPLSVPPSTGAGVASQNVVEEKKLPQLFDLTSPRARVEMVQKASDQFDFWRGRTCSKLVPWFESYPDQDRTIRMLPRNTG
jgi:hypothetical protein